jgi:hypothetical protein
LQALQLYVKGITSHSELGKALGKSRQQAQQLTARLRRKALTAQASSFAATREAYPAVSSNDPFPRMARRAVQGEFVLRATTQLREDGRDAPADECSVIWTHRSLPRELGWTWTTARTPVWTVAHTRAIYDDWNADLSYRKQPYTTRLCLPVLPEEGPNSVAELTRTLAWVIGTETLMHEDLLALSA